MGDQPHLRSPTGAVSPLRVRWKCGSARTAHARGRAGATFWLRSRVDVGSCGCLGRCGAGPNVAASVAGSAAVFGHVSTAARGAKLLEHLLGSAEFDAALELTALATREKAKAALEKGDADEAEALLTEVWTGHMRHSATVHAP